MTTAEATVAAIEAKKVAADAWIKSYEVVQKTYTQYLLAEDLGIEKTEAGNRYLAARTLERKASRAYNKAIKLCKFLGVTE